MQPDLLKTALSRHMLMTKVRVGRRPLRVTTLLAKLEKSGAVTVAGPTSTAISPSSMRGSPVESVVGQISTPPAPSPSGEGPTGGSSFQGLMKNKLGAPNPGNITSPSPPPAPSAPSPGGSISNSSNLKMTPMSSSFSQKQIAKGNQVGSLSLSNLKTAPKLKDLGIPMVVTSALRRKLALLRKQAAAAPMPIAPSTPPPPSPNLQPGAGGAPVPDPGTPPPAQELPQGLPEIKDNPDWLSSSAVEKAQQYTTPEGGLWPKMKEVAGDVADSGVLGKAMDIGTGAMIGGMVMPGVGHVAGGLIGAAWDPIKSFLGQKGEARQVYTPSETLTRVGASSKEDFIAKAQQGEIDLNDPTAAGLYRYYTLPHGISIQNKPGQSKADEAKAWEEAYNKAMSEQEVTASLRVLTKKASSADRAVVRGLLRKGIEKQAIAIPPWLATLGRGAATAGRGASAAASGIGRGAWNLAKYPLGGAALLGAGGLAAMTPSQEQMPGIPLLGRLAAGGLGAYGGYQLGEKFLGNDLGWAAGPLGAVLGGSLAPGMLGSLMGQPGSGMGGIANPMVGGLGTAMLYKYLNEKGDLPDFLKDIPGGALTAGAIGAFGMPMLTNALSGITGGGNLNPYGG